LVSWFLGFLVSWSLGLLVWIEFLVTGNVCFATNFVHGEDKARVKRTGMIVVIGRKEETPFDWFIFLVKMCPCFVLVDLSKESRV
jgi:hypothetical protein